MRIRPMSGTCSSAGRSATESTGLGFPMPQEIYHVSGAWELNSRIVFVQATQPREVDDRSGNDVHIFVIGQASHFGFRATQTVAPKSMSA